MRAVLNQERVITLHNSHYCVWHQMWPNGKIQNPSQDYPFFWIFPFGAPLWKNENKSCLNEFKFWEASENHNQVNAENFSCLFHVVPINLPRSPNSLGPRWSGPLLKNRLQAGGWEFASLFLRHNFFIASETGNQIVSILKSLNTVPFFYKSIWCTSILPDLNLKE